MSTRCCVHWYPSYLHALAHIKITRGLIEHVDVGLLDGDDGNGKALQLAAREVNDLAIQHVGQVQVLRHVLADLARVP